MSKGESGYLVFGTNEAKRFFQWILGCTYAKKTIRTRIAEMFHFAEAPHIIIYERNEENPWWWTVGVIVAVLIAVLSLWYTLEAAARGVLKFFRTVLREPQSTLTTPRCLSPVKDSQKCSPQQPKPSTPSEGPPRQKIRMNEPVNCVFVRPVTPKASDSPKISMQNLNSADDEEEEVFREELLAKEAEKKKKKPDPSPPPRLEDVVFDASSNVNCRPTLASPLTPRSNSANRKSSGKEKSESAHSCLSENGNVGEWVAQQIAGVQRLEAERSMAGRSEVVEPPEHLEPQLVSNGFMKQIQDLLESHLNINQNLSDYSRRSTSSNENVSEMSMVTESTKPSINEIVRSVNTEPMPDDSDESDNVILKPRVIESPLEVGKQTIGTEEEADIVIDDSHLLAETENDCDGSILVSGGAQKVLFRWTDDRPTTVDSVTMTGSFFG